MTQYYISVYSDVDNTFGNKDLERINDEMYNRVSKVLAPLHLDIVLEYDHGFGDWYNWFQVSFIDTCEPGVLFPYLRELSVATNYSFNLVAASGDTQERWCFENGSASEPEFTSDDEPFPEVESVLEMTEEEEEL